VIVQLVQIVSWENRGGERSKAEVFTFRVEKLRMVSKPNYTGEKGVGKCLSLSSTSRGKGA